jgi:hypothetical protein
MAAVVQIHSMTTASVTGNDRTGDQVRFYSSLNVAATNSTSNPITIPGAASDWSFTRQFRFYIGGTGPSNYISSLQFYSDGTMWNSAASYVLVEYDKHAPGSFIANTDSEISGTDIVGVTSGAAATLCVLTATYSGTAKYMGSLLRLQLEVGNQASPGTLGNKTITFSYNEQ